MPQEMECGLADAFEVRKSDKRRIERRIQRKYRKSNDKWQAEKIAVFGVSDAFLFLHCFTPNCSSMK